jgi:hypothetical protein
MEHGQMSALQQAKYRQDYIKAYEVEKATLPPTVRNDSQDRGGSTIFLVSGSGGRTAVTRGPRGFIPPGDNVQTQVTLTFREDHDKVIMTNFNIFRAQGDQLRMMREQSLAVIHRKQDEIVIDALETATVTLGAVTPADIMMATARANTMLYNAKVGLYTPGNIFAVVTPAVYNYMVLNVPQFTSVDYTSRRKVDDGTPSPTQRTMFMGIDWIVHPELPGAGTSSSTNFIYHRDAVGYSQSNRGIDADLDYNSEEDYTWRRTTIYHGSVKLQNAGIIKFTFDDTGLSA